MVRRNKPGIFKWNVNTLNKMIDLCRNTIFASKIIKIILDNAYCLVQCNKRGKNQESIQSSTTPDPGYHMRK